NLETRESFGRCRFPASTEWLVPCSCRAAWPETTVHVTGRIEMGVIRLRADDDAPACQTDQLTHARTEEPISRWRKQGSNPRSFSSRSGSVSRHFAARKGAKVLLKTSPSCRRAVRGNSSIAETQLIFGVLALRAAWVDGRGFVDGAEVAALEEAQSDQIGEA